MSSAMLVALSSCEDYNDQFNLDSSITDVKNSTFTLTDEDYATIAGLPANQELALSKDPEGKSYVEALKEVGSNKYFSTMITADEFIPAFLSNKYPNADKGSRFVVTSNMYKEPSGYLADFKNISTYTLSSNDYKTIWGDYINATYLSPESLSKVPSLLNGTLKDAAKGDMVVLNYAYSETEPSTGQEVPYIYKLTNSLNEEGGNYVIAAKGSDGKYYPFGKLDDESKNYGYIYPDPINVVDGIISTEDGTPQVINVEKASEGFTLKNTWQKYIYMSGTYNNFNFGLTYVVSWCAIYPNTGGLLGNIPNMYAFLNYLDTKLPLGGSYIGELYFNFGWFGILFAIFIGMFVGWTSAKVESAIVQKKWIQLGPYMVLFYSLLWWVRDYFSGWIFRTVWCAIAVWLINKFLKNRRITRVTLGRR